MTWDVGDTIYARSGGLWCPVVVMPQEQVEEGYTKCMTHDYGGGHYSSETFPDERLLSAEDYESRRSVNPILMA